MRKLLFLLLAMLLLAGVEAAIACSRLDEPPSDEELFAKASAVFVGHVVRVEEAGAVSVREWLAYPPWVKVEWRTPKAVAESSPPWPALQATFRVVEVFKGQPPADGKIRAPVGNYCTGPLFWVRLGSRNLPLRGQLRAFVGRKQTRLHSADLAGKR